MHPRAALIGNDGDGAQIGVVSRVGFRVVTRVSGDLAPALEARDLTHTYTTSWTPWKPVRLTVDYIATNTGNVALGLEDELDGVIAAQGTH